MGLHLQFAVRSRRHGVNSCYRQSVIVTLVSGVIERPLSNLVQISFTSHLSPFPALRLKGECKNIEDYVQLPPIVILITVDNWTTSAFAVAATAVTTVAEPKWPPVPAHQCSASRCADSVPFEAARGACTSTLAPASLTTIVGAHTHRRPRAPSKRRTACATLASCPGVTIPSTMRRTSAACTSTAAAATPRRRRRAGWPHRRTGSAKGRALRTTAARCRAAPRRATSTPLPVPSTTSAAARTRARRQCALPFPPLSKHWPSI